MTNNNGLAEQQLTRKVTPAKEKDNGQPFDLFDGFNTMEELCQVNKYISIEYMNETDISKSNESEKSNIHASK